MIKKKIKVQSQYNTPQNLSSNQSKNQFMKPDSIKKAKIEPIDEYDDNCIQHAVALVLNHKEIKNFVVKYNLEGVNRSSTKDDWKKTEKKKIND